MLYPIELRHHWATSRTRTGIAGATILCANHCTMVTRKTEGIGQIRTAVNRVCKSTPEPTRPRCQRQEADNRLLRNRDIPCQPPTEEARFERAVGGAAHCGLAVRCLKPLGHSSSMERRGLEPL